MKTYGWRVVRRSTAVCRLLHSPLECQSQPISHSASVTRHRDRLARISIELFLAQVAPFLHTPAATNGGRQQADCEREHAPPTQTFQCLPGRCNNDCVPSLTARADSDIR